MVFYKHKLMSRKKSTQVLIEPKIIDKTLTAVLCRSAFCTDDEVLTMLGNMLAGVIHK